MYHGRPRLRGAREGRPAVRDKGEDGMRLIGVAGRGVGLAAALLAGVLGMPGAPAAADRDGVVVAVQPREGTFAVGDGNPAGGPVVTFRTDAETRVTFGRKVVPFGNLVPGDRVSVRYRNQDLGPVATAVQIHRLRPPR
jgi:hypothetical protein